MHSTDLALRACIHIFGTYLHICTVDLSKDQDPANLVNRLSDIASIAVDPSSQFHLTLLDETWDAMSKDVDRDWEMLGFQGQQPGVVNIH